MLRCFRSPRVWALACILFPTLSFGDSLLNIGILSFDPYNASNTAATFDIANLTGSNALPPDFNVSTPVTLSDLSLKLDFVGGGTSTIDASQFTSDGAGGYTGNFHVDLSMFSIADATVTGVFDPTMLMTGDHLWTSIYPSFTTTMTDTPELALGDTAVITASATPEPFSLGLAGLGAALVLFGRRRSR